MMNGKRLWTDAEEKIGVNQKNKLSEVSETEQIRQLDGTNRMAKKVCVGKECSQQMEISAEEIIEQMGFTTALKNLDKMPGETWLEGVAWCHEEDKMKEEAKHTPQARV